MSFEFFLLCAGFDRVGRSGRSGQLRRIVRNFCAEPPWPTMTHHFFSIELICQNLATQEDLTISWSDSPVLGNQKIIRAKQQSHVLIFNTWLTLILFHKSVCWLAWLLLPRLALYCHDTWYLLITKRRRPWSCITSLNSHSTITRFSMLSNFMHSESRLIFGSVIVQCDRFTTLSRKQDMHIIIYLS